MTVKGSLLKFFYGLVCLLVFSLGGTEEAMPQCLSASGSPSSVTVVKPFGRETIQIQYSILVSN